jgi:hypothetical protein
MVLLVAQPKVALDKTFELTVAIALLCGRRMKRRRYFQPLMP